MSAAEVDLEATGEFVRLPAAHQAPPESAGLIHAMNQRHAAQQATRVRGVDANAAAHDEPSNRTRVRTDTNPAWTKRRIAPITIERKVESIAPVNRKPVEHREMEEAIPAIAAALAIKDPDLNDEPVIRAAHSPEATPSLDSDSSVPAPASTKIGGNSKLPWIVAVLAAVVVGVAVWWVMFQRLPDIDPRQVIATNLAAAKSALDSGKVIDPPERSAIHYYSTVLSLDPANVPAREAMAKIADGFIADAKANLVNGNLAATVGALQSARRVQPDDSRLTALDSQLREQLEEQMQLSRESVVVAAQPQVAEQGKPAEARPAPRTATIQQDPHQLAVKALEDANQAIERGQLDVASILIDRAKDAGVAASDLALLNTDLARAEQGRSKNDLLQLVLQRTAENQLLEPAQDSAKHYLDQLVQADAAFPGVKQGVRALGGRLVANAQMATYGKDFDLAARLLTQARAIGFSGVDVDAAETALSAARKPVAALAAAANEPKLVKFVQPEYPQEGRIRGTEGWVDLALAVTPAGEVTDARILNSNVSAAFGRAAVAASKQWKYEPRVLADADTAKDVKVRVTFKIGEEKSRQRLSNDALSMNR